MLRPPIGMRRNSIIAVPDLEQLAMLPRPDVDAASTRPEVDPRLCAAARHDIGSGFSSPAAWRGLLAWLVDHGYETGVVEEELVPVTDPSAKMFVACLDEALRWTAPRLMDEVLAYFRDAAERYLDTWRPLTDMQDDKKGGWEVLVPPAAVLAVTRADTLMTLRRSTMPV